MSATTIGPVRRTVGVDCDPATAWRVFTEELGAWWPTETHAIAAGAVAELAIEPRVGGEWYELSTTGERNLVATVLAWEPPHRLVVAWKVDPERPATEVEVRFVPYEDGSGTRVELEHRGWADDESRGSYDQGWELVLGRYVARVVASA
jgi:uncharacterized protein YndB with AHSA1/START domain